MKNILSKRALLISALFLSQPAFASGTLDTYNLIVKDDLTSSQHIYEKVIVGGDLHIDGNLEVGSRINSDPKVDAVSVVGDINSGLLKAMQGHNIVYGGVNSANVELNGSGGSIRQENQAQLGQEFDVLYDQVMSESLYYKNLTANSIFDTSDTNNMKLISGASVSDPLQIYDIAATDTLSVQNASFDFSSKPTTPVVINVSGTDIIIKSKATGSFATQQFASMVLWNFYEAESIEFSQDGWYGSVLAPYADITAGNAGAMNGSIAALSYEGNIEIHNALYNYTPPTPPTAVSEPGSLIVFATGLLALIRIQRRKRV